MRNENVRSKLSIINNDVDTNTYTQKKEKKHAAESIN